jgi:hypothetical protein
VVAKGKVPDRDLHITHKTDCPSRGRLNPSVASSTRAGF